MARDQLIPLPWPKAGIVENAAFYEQPDGTTTDALNVRNFDAIDRRNRGGQRTGIDKYLADAVNGSNAIQDINSVVLAFDSSTVIADTLLFEEDLATFSNSDLMDDDTGTKWDEFNIVSVNSIAKLTDANRSLVKLNDGTNDFFQLPDGSQGSSDSILHYLPTLVIGTSYTIRAEIRPPLSAASASDRGVIGIASRLDRTTLQGLSEGANAATRGLFVGWRAAGTSSGGIQTVQVQRSDPSSSNFLTSGTNVGSTFTVDDTDYMTIELRVNGNSFSFYQEGNLVGSWTTTENPSFTGLGMYVEDDNSDLTPTKSPRVRNFKVFTAIQPASLRTTKLVAVSGGSIFSGNKLDGLALTTNGSSALTQSGLTSSVGAFQRMYFADGLESGYKVLDPVTDVVTNWADDITSGALPAGGTGTAFDITAVDTALKTFTAAEDLSSVFSVGDSLVVEDSLPDSTNENKDNDGTYIVTVVTGSGPTVITVGQTIPSTSVSGSFRLATVACRQVTLFRGRAFVWGLETDPQNWFASASGDLNNFDYFPSVITRTQAVAGNNGLAGKLGDVITCMASYTDDIMIMGGANSIAVMRGDPAAGGVIDIISQNIGVTGPRAWAFDTGSNFYFFGINGLYRMDLNSFQPVLLSQNKLDKTFADINTAQNHILLAYDPEWQGVHVFVSPPNQPTTAATHYFWDERNNAFWPDQYPIAHGPTVVHRFNADNPENSALLMGGYDSTLRAFSDTATDDDGTVISSHCRFTPISQGSALASSRIHDVTIIMDKGSAATTYKMFAGDTPEQAEDNADADVIRVQRTLTSGRNSPIRNRVSQNTIMVELSQAGVGGVGATWAFEAAMARIAVLGRMHGRGV